MAHFYGWLKGEHGKKVSHIGSETSGLNGVLNGLSFGVRVSLFNDGIEDKAEVFLTFGSNDESNGLKRLSIGTFSRVDLLTTHKKRKNEF